jgi:hypothetical protein
MINKDFVSFDGLELLSPDDLINIFAEPEQGLPAVSSSTSSRDENDFSRTPRLPKNDIRRHFPKAFVSAVNSGSTDQIEGLAKAFIYEDCIIAWSTSWNGISFANMPASNTARGPEQFAHLVHGCWVIFPDFMMTKLASWIAFSTVEPGRSTLYLDVNIAATVTSSLPCDLWIPPLDRLPSLYAASTAMQLRAAIERPSPRESPSAIDQMDFPPPNTSSNTSTSAYISTTRTAAKQPVAGVASKTSATTITECFVQALYQSATPVRPPVSMQLRGQFCFDFDEQNRIVQLSFSVAHA